MKGTLSLGRTRGTAFLRGMALFGLLFSVIQTPSCTGTPVSEPAAAEAAEDTTTHRLTILFAGDMMGHDGQIAAAKRADGYDYAPYFEHVGRIAAADLAVANLEVTLAGEPYKGYPQFSSPDDYLEAIKAAGFDVIETANNHCLDGRQRGLQRTIEQIDKSGLPRMGTYLDQADRDKQYPLLVEKNGIRLVFLNYTYGTNGIKVQEPNVVNYIDRAVIAKDIEKAKAMNPDAIIASIHWGIEYVLLPNQTQKDLADWLFEQGVTHVIGGHPHVVQPMEVRTDSLGQKHFLVYSLGNYCSNMSRVNTDGGILVQLTLEKKAGKTSMTDCGYGFIWVSRPTISGRDNFHVFPSTMPKEDLKPVEITRMKTFTDNMRKLFKEHNVGDIKEIDLTK